MSSTAINSSSPCYQFEDNRIRQFVNWLPCGPWTSGGPVLSCCQVDDFCMSDGICHSTNSSDGESGYYQSSCTDPNYQDNLCPYHCNDQPFPDVTYNNGLDEWQCCGANSKGNVSCNSPTTNEFFNGPVPSELATTASAGQTTLPSSSSSSQSSSATSAASSAPASATSTAGGSEGGISTGAVAGIVVAIVLIGLVAVGALIFFLRRKRRRRRDAAAPRELADNAVPHDPKINAWQVPGVVPSAEADSAEIHEMDIQQGKKMYFDHAKQQWMYEQPTKPSLLRNPTEMSADQVPRFPRSRQPVELSADSRPGEALRHER